MLNELVNPDLDEILGTAPHKIVRWGNTFIFIFFVFLISSTFIVKYPEIIKGNIILTASSQPSKIIAKRDGRIIKFLIKNGQEIRTGQILGYFETSAGYDEVVSLKEDITRAVFFLNENKFNKIRLKNYNSLGELQKSYQVVFDMYTKITTSLSGNSYITNINMLEKDIENYNNIKENYLNQLNIYESDLRLSEEEKNINEKLLSEKVISPLDYKIIMSKYLNKKTIVFQTKNAIYTNDLLIDQKRKELINFRRSSLETINNFKQAIHVLNSEISNWTHNNVIISPSHGLISITKNLHNNIQVKAGDEILNVISKHSNYFAEMNVGQFNFGKVRNGQSVIIKLDSYPFEEYGSILGQISRVSDVASNSSNFVVEINLPHGLITSTKKSVFYKNGMIASGEIITKDQTLFNRLLYKVIRVSNEH